MVQRIFEIATGVCAAVSGWLLLYMIFFANTVGGPNGSYNYVSHYRDLSWLPAFVAFAAALTVIALGALLHSVLSFSQNGRHAHPVFSLLGVVALWLATAVLMVMIILAGLSIGLAFIPSAVLALIACVLALIPGLPAAARAVAVRAHAGVGQHPRPLPRCGGSGASLW